MPRAPRICSHPDCDATVTTGSRCTPHKVNRGNRSPTYLQRTSADQRARAVLVRAWVAEHGMLCPGYLIPAHPATRLTAAHRIPAAHGGTIEADGGSVLCDVCNSRQGTRVS